MNYICIHRFKWTYYFNYTHYVSHVQVELLSVNYCLFYLKTMYTQLLLVPFGKSVYDETSPSTDKYNPIMLINTNSCHAEQEGIEQLLLPKPFYS